MKKPPLKKSATRGRPPAAPRPRVHLFVNMAMSADGKIATANRKVSKFSSKRDGEELMLLRTRADAVMAGARTVDLNPVSLGPGAARYRRMRLRGGLSEYNLRIIVSRRCTIDPEAAIFKQKFSPVLVITTGQASAENLRRVRRVADEVVSFGEREIDFRRFLDWLAVRWNVKHLLCEGGGELNDALFKAGVVNELHLTICPRLIGGKGAPTIADASGVQKLAQATELVLKSYQLRGDELFLVYEVLPHLSR
ncbi:MAG TPA: dihydrofolate reductase family protein [Verrucomicrobiae bacterium]|nr:dihydrofolate reductase family protein [Verrucomicrobiae bacterium]